MTYFYPRPPRGGRQSGHPALDAGVRNFYPRPPRGGRHFTPAELLTEVNISIHALREEGDDVPDPEHHPLNHFYPRPPRGGRLLGQRFRLKLKKFLSTPSARRATRQRADQYVPGEISIHALREEGDLDILERQLQINKFLSTPSARRATKDGNKKGFEWQISIHALREEGDDRGDRHRSGRTISIHALREEGDRRRPRQRPVGRISIHALREEGDFLPTAFHRGRSISIHALREEGDFCFFDNAPDLLNFYPRPPRGGRPPFLILATHDSIISIHALREEGDPFPHAARPPERTFLSTPSARRATALKYAVKGAIAKFLSTPSARRATVVNLQTQKDAKISIHALREEGDRFRPPSTHSTIISIHALREEGDAFIDDFLTLHLKFLSTPSARRATS